MGLSTTRVKGVRVPLANTAPTIVADVTGMRDDLVIYGNRRVGTKEEREALNGALLWEGLEFLETDTGRTFLYQGGAWRASRLATHRAAGALLVGIVGPGTNSVQMPAGLLFKSGYLTTATTLAFGNEYLSAVGFETPFPNACLGVQITQLHTDGATSRDIAIDTVSAGQFRAFYPGGSVSSKRSIMWLAYGY